MNKTTSMENKGWGEERNWQKQTLPRSRPTHEWRRHCTNQQQHTINRTAWLPITHKAQHKEHKTAAPLADNVYHLPKITEKTTQKEAWQVQINMITHGQSSPAVRTIYEYRIKKIFRNLGLRVVYILDSITM